MFHSLEFWYLFRLWFPDPGVEQGREGEYGRPVPSRSHRILNCTPETRAIENYFVKVSCACLDKFTEAEECARNAEQPYQDPAIEELVFLQPCIHIVHFRLIRLHAPAGLIHRASVPTPEH